MNMSGMTPFPISLKGGIHTGVPEREICESPGAAASSGFIEGRNIRCTSNGYLLPREGCERIDTVPRTTSLASAGRFLAEYGDQVFWGLADGKLRSTLYSTTGDPGLVSGIANEHWSSTVLGSYGTERLYVACGWNNDIIVINAADYGSAGSVLTESIGDVAPVANIIRFSPTGEKEILGTAEGIRAKRVCAHGNRLFAAQCLLRFGTGTDASVPLIASDISNTTYRDARGYGNQWSNINISFASVGEDIEAMASLTGGLLLLTRNGAWMLRGEFGYGHSIQRLTLPGIADWRTLAVTRSRSAYYLSDRGVVETDGESFRLVAAPQMQGAIDSFVRPFSCRGVWDDVRRRYWLAATVEYPRPDRNGPSEIYEIEPDRGDRVWRHTGLEVEALAMVQGRPSWIDSTGRIWKGNSGFADFADPLLVAPGSAWINIAISTPPTWPLVCAFIAPNGGTSSSYAYFDYLYDNAGVWTVTSNAGIADRIRVYIARPTGFDPVALPASADHPFNGTHCLAGMPVQLNFAISTVIRNAAIQSTGSGQYYYIDVDYPDMWGLQRTNFAAQLGSGANTMVSGYDAVIGQIPARASLTLSCGYPDLPKRWGELHVQTRQGAGGIGLLHWNMDVAPGLVDVAAAGAGNFVATDSPTSTLLGTGGNTTIAGVSMNLGSSFIRAVIGGNRCATQKFLVQWLSYFTRRSVSVPYEAQDPIAIEAMTMYFAPAFNRRLRDGGTISAAVNPS